jgi:hypothetical protein
LIDDVAIQVPTHKRDRVCTGFEATGVDSVITYSFVAQCRWLGFVIAW